MHPGILTEPATPIEPRAGRFVAYYCASSNARIGFGLDLDAQQKAIGAYLDGQPGSLAGSFTETMLGRYSRRPELARALALCTSHRATLLVATFGPIFRNLGFLMTVARTGVACAAADTPHGVNSTSNFGTVFTEYWR